MSFQGYLRTIKEKTGLTPAELREKANEKGFTVDGNLNPATKAGDIVKWLKEEYDLGHGHSMAVYALLKGIKNEDSE
ncbi:DUF4287 domain-containing protein [bacterium]|nr:MAG: DUF4287 domain-containing protein [bacterium]